MSWFKKNKDELIELVACEKCSCEVKKQNAHVVGVSFTSYQKLNFEVNCLSKCVDVSFGGERELYLDYYCQRCKPDYIVKFSDFGELAVLKMEDGMLVREKMK